MRSERGARLAIALATLVAAGAVDVAWLATSHRSSAGDTVANSLPAPTLDPGGAVLSANEQPPDPCALLTVAEVDAATTEHVRPPKPSELAGDALGQRLCFWFAAPKNFLLSLSVQTAQSLAASKFVDKTVAAEFRSLSEPLPTRIPSLGSEASYDQRVDSTGASSEILVVASPAAVFEIQGDAITAGDPEGPMETLAADVMRRYGGT